MGRDRGFQRFVIIFYTSKIYTYNLKMMSEKKEQNGEASGCHLVRLSKIRFQRLSLDLLCRCNFLRNPRAEDRLLVLSAWLGRPHHLHCLSLLPRSHGRTTDCSCRAKETRARDLYELSP